MDLFHLELFTPTSAAFWNHNAYINFYDVEKAFDSISHDAIKRTFTELKAPVSVCHCVSTMLDNTWAQVVVNGELTEPFLIQRGVKQGDPISPLFFALSIEPLSRSISGNEMIRGVIFPGNIRFNHCLFADDMAAVQIDSESEENTKKLLSIFEKSHACKVNNDKCFSLVFRKGTIAPYKIIEGDNHIDSHN
jgi:hypothetical protein